MDPRDERDERDELVVVVAARRGYTEYLEVCAQAPAGAFVARPGTRFRAGATRLAFYQGGTIRPEVPRILGTREVELAPDRVAALGDGDDPLDAAAAEVLRVLVERGRDGGGTATLVLLSRPGDGDTTTLPAPVAHARDGRGFTRAFRYVPAGRLLAGPATTASLTA
jgi:hypothetical protein